MNPVESQGVVEARARTMTASAVRGLPTASGSRVGTREGEAEDRRVQRGQRHKHKISSWRTRDTWAMGSNFLVGDAGDQWVDLLEPYECTGANRPPSTPRAAA